ncbi:hypothetical protein SLEP1_g13661 [Rubroshorea leprosula]|uniref:Uncharacterized protein n=1 Tax=Rubroshorea leprosula TaxID=152421 RepID=A0AAV5IGM6_9ROSI|nr:hypothetical protein SLEP1_g13661 [Rubroshorea leprosula]
MGCQRFTISLNNSLFLGLSSLAFVSFYFIVFYFLLI